ncbi:MAG: protein-disulfide reductase DsbD domain-containing protein [Pseudomonadota bacterium]|nr:protein-disulfide reductase DsbD domain-containing protein [Pseudomonadota bacterium]
MWLLAALLALVPVCTRAAPVQARHVTVDLLTETSTVAGGESLWVLLTFAPETHWHTYWKNPGDSGLAPKLNWQLPPGWQAREPLFPTPAAIPYGSQINYGYESESGLLVELVPPLVMQEENVALTLDARWLVCADACVPGQAEFKLELPVTRFAAPNPRHKSRFAQARFSLPLQLDIAGTYRVQGEQILVDLPARTLPRSVSRVFIAPGQIAEAELAPDLTFKEDRLLIRLNRHSYFSKAPPQIEVVLELAGQGWSVPARLQPQGESQ